MLVAGPDGPDEALAVERTDVDGDLVVADAAGQNLDPDERQEDLLDAPGPTLLAPWAPDGCGIKDRDGFWDINESIGGESREAGTEHGTGMGPYPDLNSPSSRWYPLYVLVHRPRGPSSKIKYSHYPVIRTNTLSIVSE